MGGDLVGGGKKAHLEGVTAGDGFLGWLDGEAGGGLVGAGAGIEAGVGGLGGEIEEANKENGYEDNGSEGRGHDVGVAIEDAFKSGIWLVLWSHVMSSKQGLGGFVNGKGGHLRN